MQQDRPSPAFEEWRSSRRANVDELKRAHRLVRNAGPGTGSGRPPKAGTQQLNEALVLRIVTEFQGFVRELFDLATENLIRGAGCSSQLQLQLKLAATRDRRIDRGNPSLDAIATDALRLGIAQLNSQLLRKNNRHRADKDLFEDLVGLRNALAHDDQEKVLRLSQSGVRPTLRYIEASQAATNRHARALDRVVWDYLSDLFPATDPWNP